MSIFRCKATIIIVEDDGDVGFLTKLDGWHFKLGYKLLKEFIDLE